MNDGKSWLNEPRECAVHNLHGTFLFHFPFLLHHPVRLLQHSRKIKLSFPAWMPSAAHSRRSAARSTMPRPC